MWRRLLANVGYFVRTSGRGIEHAAIFVVASVIALNIVGLASRPKTDEVLVVASKEDLPTPLLAGDTTAREGQEKRTRVKPAPRPRETGSLRPPQPAGMFETQRQILDATGRPALDPHRGAPLPLKLDIVAHADAVVEPQPETRSVAAEQPVVQSELKAAQPTHARKRKPTEAAERRQRRTVAALEELAEARQPHAPRAKARKGDVAVPATKRAKMAKAELAADTEPAAGKKAKPEKAAATAEAAPKKAKANVVARSTSNSDPTPGELVLRSLRGA